MTSFSDIFSFARASAATYVDASGILQTAASGVARTGHHIYSGSAWVNEGLLLESEARTNLLLNSGTLATQSRTVTAVPHTLHFTGTGTITLSGVSTAGPLVGTGTGENNRVSLTFTPTAGTLTLTVSGTVTNAQLEIGSTPSSYIPTEGATATRAAETLSIAGADMPYSATAISIAVEGKMTYADTDTFDTVGFHRWLSGSAGIRAKIDTDTSRTGRTAFRQNDGVTQYSVLGGNSDFSPGVNVPFSIASRHGSTFLNGAVNGVALTADLTPTALPNLTAATFQIAHTFMGTIKTLRVWSDDIGNVGIAETSA
jgi:hypothetical protein